MRDLSRTMLSVDDAKTLAVRRLPKSLVYQVEAGTGLATTIAANLRAFEEVTFRPRVAVSFPERNLKTTILGHEISMPVITAPTGNIRIYNREGEPGVARAADAAGTIACFSAFTGYPIEEVAAASKGPVFFQLYYVGGRNNVPAMIERAKSAGVKALILTVDSAAWAQRERNFKLRIERPPTSLRAMARFAPQVLTKPAWFADFLRDGRQFKTPMVLGPDGQPVPMWQAAASIMRETPVWEDIPWIRELWGGPIIVKGILRAEDASRAVAEGASAIVVSNHGGNALDGAPATLRVLEEILDAVGDQAEVILDSGVRRGSDVVKALALGARAVIIGRGYLWAHAAAGSAGVSQILEVFRTGIDQTLALLGCPSVHELDRSYVSVPASWDRRAPELADRF
jgi:isopentenyl diphosphate isomerase/L-lactate dehydrogenase-like FMN-dependent dehydrogenase